MDTKNRINSSPEIIRYLSIFTRKLIRREDQLAIPCLAHNYNWIQEEEEMKLSTVEGGDSASI